MLRKILLLVSLPFITLSSVSLGANSASAASLSSQPASLSESTDNKPVLIGQYYPDRDSDRQMRRRCRKWREYIEYNHDYLSRWELRQEWRRYQRMCRSYYEGFHR